MRASARLRLPSGDIVELLPGDLIGRTSMAALHLDDPRISEAHALISLRGGELQILSLRRMIAVDGKGVSSAVLRAGLVVALADGVEFVVEEVHLPGALPALEAEGAGRRLLGSVASVLTRPSLQILPRYAPEADAHVWLTDGAWRVQVAGTTPQLIGLGESFAVGPHTLHLVGVPITSAGQTPTRVEGGVQAPLRVVAQFDTAHIHRREHPPLVLGGRGARIVSELVSFGGPVAWQVLAGEVWPDFPDPAVLRHRLDVNLARLRSRLRGAGIRPDLVRSDGAGKVELVLCEGDTVEDRT